MPETEWARRARERDEWWQKVLGSVKVGDCVAARGRESVRVVTVTRVTPKLLWNRNEQLNQRDVLAGPLLEEQICAIEDANTKFGGAIVQAKAAYDALYDPAFAEWEATMIATLGVSPHGRKLFY